MYSSRNHGAVLVTTQSLASADTGRKINHRREKTRSAQGRFTLSQGRKFFIIARVGPRLSWWGRV